MVEGHVRFVRHGHGVPDAQRRQVRVVPGVGAVEHHGAGVVGVRFQVDDQFVGALLDSIADVNIRSPEHALVLPDFDAVQVHLHAVGNALEIQIHVVPRAAVIEVLFIVPVPLQLLLGCRVVQPHRGIADNARLVQRGGNTRRHRHGIRLAPVVPALVREQPVAAVQHQPVVRIMVCPLSRFERDHFRGLVHGRFSLHRCGAFRVRHAAGKRHHRAQAERQHCRQ